VNDSMALGRPTQGVEGADSDRLESSPAVISSLHGFRAVRVGACDSYSLALDDTGSVRAWGTFKVCLLVHYDFLLNSPLHTASRW
jgi:regulator of chromosome condensation